MNWHDVIAIGSAAYVLSHVLEERRKRRQRRKVTWRPERW